MKIAINSGLGDMVWFLPFAVELSKKCSFEIVGNKYSAEVCAMAGIENVTHDTQYTVLIPPPGAIVARIKRYGEKNYRQIYAESTGCAGDLSSAHHALGIHPPEKTPKTLLFDAPRASGLGSMTYTPNIADFSKEILKVSDNFGDITPLSPQPSLRDLFATVSGISAGLGQIGFLTALCHLFGKPFYAVRADGETDEKFNARKRVVCL